MYIVVIRDDFNNENKQYFRITLDSSKKFVLEEMRKKYKETDDIYKRKIILYIIKNIDNDIMSFGYSINGDIISYDIVPRKDFEMHKKEKIDKERQKIDKLSAEIEKIKKDMDKLSKKMGHI